MEENISLKKVFKENELSEIDLENISFENPIYNDNSCFIPINSDYYIQLEKVSFNSFINCNNNIFLPLKINNNLDNLQNFFLQLDNYLVNCVSENFSTWFKKYITIENLLDFYIPTDISINEIDMINSEDTIIYEKNKIYFPILQVPYDIIENDIDILILNIENQPIEQFQELKNISNSTILIKLHGINIEKKKFHAVWELIQMKILSK